MLAEPAAKPGRSVMTKETFAETCIANNARYAETFDRADVPRPPARKAAVVACMDARIETGRVLGLVAGWW